MVLWDWTGCLNQSLFPPSHCLCFSCINLITPASMENFGVYDLLSAMNAHGLMMKGGNINIQNWYSCLCSAVIANGLCKKLCLRMFPQLSAVDSVVERGNRRRNPIDVGSCNSAEWESLEREHRAFAFLARQCKTLPATSCIADAVCASSTDNYPFESIVNTLERGDRVGPRASYWSSKGQRDHTVPETLVYKLDAVFCFITEINVQPFQGYWSDIFTIACSSF